MARSSGNSRATRKPQKPQIKAKSAAENRARKVKTESVEYTRSVYEHTHQCHESPMETSSESEGQYDTEDYEPEADARTRRMRKRSSSTVDECMTSKTSTSHKISILQMCCQHKDRYLNTPRGHELGFYEYIFKKLSKLIRAQYSQGAKDVQRDVDNWVGPRRKALVDSHKGGVPMGKPQNELEYEIDKWNNCFSVRRCRLEAAHFEQGIFPSMKEDIHKKVIQTVNQHIRKVLGRIDKKLPRREGCACIQTAKNNLNRADQRLRYMDVTTLGELEGLNKLLGGIMLEIGDFVTSETGSRLKALTSKPRAGRGETEESNPGSELGHRSESGYGSGSRRESESEPEDGTDGEQDPMEFDHEGSGDEGYKTSNQCDDADDGIYDYALGRVSSDVPEASSPKHSYTRRSDTRRERTTQAGTVTPSSSSRPRRVNGKGQKTGSSLRSSNKGKEKARPLDCHQDLSTETRPWSEQTPVASSSSKRKRKSHSNRTPTVAGPSTDKRERRNCFGTMTNREGEEMGFMSGGRDGILNKQLVTPPETGSRNHGRPRITSKENIIDLTLDSDPPSDCEEAEAARPQSKRRRGGTRRSDPEPALQSSSPSARRGKKRFGRGNPQRIPHGSGF